MKKFIKIVVPEDKRMLPEFNVVWTYDPPVAYINHQQQNNIKEAKKMIDLEEFHDKWDDIKKYNNLYELVHVSSNRKKLGENIAYYIPLSRSYFKMIEIIQDFSLLNDLGYNEQFVSGHLAEGPGGFIEALINKLKSKKRNLNDRFYGITLQSSCKEIPGWEKSRYFLSSHPEVSVYYGKDNTGNIYNIENLFAFREYIGKKCNIVTGDGGFDFSIDFNLQEILSYRLIICQIIGALMLLKDGGHFVCKVFDTYCRVSVELLWIVSLCFNEMNIMKPLTSRPANSERYIVAKYYRNNIGHIILNHLINIVNNWDEEAYLASILENSTIPTEFLEFVSEYNVYYYENQLLNINQTIDMIHNYNEYNFKDLLKNQIQSSMKWCLKYKLALNRNCIYIPK